MWIYSGQIKYEYLLDVLTTSVREQLSKAENVRERGGEQQGCCSLLPPETNLIQSRDRGSNKPPGFCQQYLLYDDTTSELSRGCWADSCSVWADSMVYTDCRAGNWEMIPTISSPGVGCQHSSSESQWMLVFSWARWGSSYTTHRPPYLLIIIRLSYMRLVVCTAGAGELATHNTYSRLLPTAALEPESRLQAKELYMEGRGRSQVPPSWFLGYGQINNFLPLLSSQIINNIR